jgi:hypothetical protein
MQIVHSIVDPTNSAGILAKFKESADVRARIAFAIAFAASAVCAQRSLWCTVCA